MMSSASSSLSFGAETGKSYRILTLKSSNLETLNSHRDSLSVWRRNERRNSRLPALYPVTSLERRTRYERAYSAKPPESVAQVLPRHCGGRISGVAGQGSGREPASQVP